MRTGFKSLYLWIVLAFIAGIILGLYKPDVALLLQPLATSFIQLIKMFIGPIVFFTLVSGIAHTASIKKLAGTGIKALIYFELVSTLALCVGWAAASFFKPGAGINANASNLSIYASSQPVPKAPPIAFFQSLEHLVPNSLLDPFADGNMLQIVLLAILFGIAILSLGKARSHAVLDLIDALTQTLFKIIRMIMWLAPIGVFGAMSYTVAKFGGVLLIPLLSLIGTFYGTAFIFVVFILGALAWISGFSLLKLVKYLLPEILLVLGTSSSEAALPQLIDKLEQLGCEPETVGLVVPLGYAFNLDGTNIYIVLAAMFIAQAFGIELSLVQQLTLFLTAMISSKGAAGITGSGFITLAATLSMVKTIPEAGLVLILGVDRFMSEVRALVNFIGNAVGCLIISFWQKDITPASLKKALGSPL